MQRNHQFWTERDTSLVARARSFSDLAHTALAVLARMPKPVGRVCGPISTGGTGSMENNWGSRQNN